MSSPFPRTHVAFVLALISASALVGTMVELMLIGHWERPGQWWSWVAVACGAVAVLAAAGSWQHAALIAFAMAGVAGFIGALGAFEHISANRDFVLELRPDTSMVTSWWAAARGKLPALAPMSLALPAGLAALAAAAGSTEADPFLERRPQVFRAVRLLAMVALLVALWLAVFTLSAHPDAAAAL